MVSPRARWPPVSFGGPVRARKPGGVRTKGREKLPVASPPSCLPRPLPSSPAPSSFKPRLARVVSVQSRPPPSEEMAEEPEPQVKGARPPPAPGLGAPRRALRSPPEPPSSLPCSLARPPPRMTPAPALGSAPLGRPLPTRLRSEPSSEEAPGEPPACTVFYHHTHSRGQTGWLGGGGVPLLPPGPGGRRERAGGCVRAWVGGGLFRKSWVAPPGGSPGLQAWLWGTGGGEGAGAGSPAMAPRGGGPGQLGNSQNNAS